MIGNNNVATASKVHMRDSKTGEDLYYTLHSDVVSYILVIKISKDNDKDIRKRTSFN